MAFIPWILFLEECSPRRAFWRSYLLGLLFFSGTMWWVGCVAIPGVIPLVLALAFYFAVWGWLANRVMAKQSPWRAMIILPSSWVALEYIRSHFLTGLGWNLLAHTQWNWICLIQISDRTGVWGVSFLVVLVNVALCQALRRKKNSWAALLLAGLAVLGSAQYGRAVVRRLDARITPPGFKVALLQGNIPQREKWDEVFQEAIWKRYGDLVAQAVKQKPDLIVWPETSVPGYLEEPEIADRLKEISRSAGVEMLVGVPTEDEATGRPTNSAVLLDRAGEGQDHYAKIHLVPFGEFIPLQPVLGWLKTFYPVADFVPGKEWTVFSRRPDDAIPPFSVLVCFEDLFPELTRRFVKEGAGWMLVITNDAWFGRSAASVQHLQASVFRAVECHIWIGRAANNGWTGFVDPAGRRLPRPGQIPRFKPGVAVADLPVIAHSKTLYVRCGDWFPILCLAAVCLAFLPSRRPL